MGKTRGERAAVATHREVEQAIETLTPVESQRLLDYASRRSWGLKSRGRGVDAEDLIQEAIRRVAAGARKWRPDEVSFVDYLLQVMSSLRSHEVSKVKGRVAIAEVADVDSGEPVSVYELLPADVPDPEGSALAATVLARIRRHFAADSIALNVIDGLEVEMTGPEIQEALGITVNEYDAAMRRIRRYVRRGEAS